LILAWGVTIAGFAQLLMMAIAAYRAGMGLGFRWPRLTPDIRQLVKLGIPGVISGGITQINLMIGGVIASYQDGARAFLYYADRLYQLPLGVVGVAIGVVLLPDLVRHLARKNDAAALDALNRSLEFALLLTVPAALRAGLGPAADRGAVSARSSWRRTYASAQALPLPRTAGLRDPEVFQPAYFAPRYGTPCVSRQ
jgi:putative peptidoglycan lipid II flippase